MNMERSAKKLNHGKVLKIIYAIIMSVFSSFIILFDWNKLKEPVLFEMGRDSWWQYLRYGLDYYIITALLIMLLILTVQKEKLNKALLFIALAFGCIETISLNFYYFYSFAYNLSDFRVAIFNVLSFLAYSNIAHFAATLFLKIIRKISAYNIGQNGKRIKEKLDINIGKVSFLFILICWLPWILAFYPGSLWYDMCYQIEQYYGTMSYNLHPYFVTLIMGWCLDIGKIVFHSDDAGIFIYTLLQTIVCCYAYSKVTVWLWQKGQTIISLLALLFFGIYPIFGAYAQYGTKDILVYGLFTLFFLQTIYWYEKLRNGVKPTVADIIKYALISLLCSLYRHEMIIICCSTILVLLIWELIRNNKGAIVGLMVTILMIIAPFKIFNNVIVPQLAGEGGAAAQELAVPLRQIARFATYHSDWIDEEEYGELQNLFSFNINDISQKYNPYLSDPLVFSYNEDNNSLWKIYLSFLKKSPTTYIESFISSSYGYYSIVPRVPYTINNAETNGTPGERFSFYINRDPDLDYNLVVVSYSERTARWREKLSNYAYAWRDIPGICLLYSLGFYTWIYILLIYYVLEKRDYDKLICFFPTFLIICVCLVSPANDYMRYYVCVLTTLYGLLGVALDK